jgi:8-oxo-dGTP diphosphatase
MSTAESTDKPILNVAVGVVINPEGQVLIAQRPMDKHMGGAWEFPGGKVEAGETVLEALHRELLEELGMTIANASALMTHRHEYPDRVVNLQVLAITDAPLDKLGDIGAEGQPLRWVFPKNLMESGLLPADEPIARHLREWLD